MGNPGYAPKTVPWWGMLLYLVVGIVWVFAGDILLAHFVTDPQQLTRFQTWKGWGYVLLTSAMAWWLLQRVRRAESRRSAMAQELSQIARHVPAGIARVASGARPDPTQFDPGSPYYDSASPPENPRWLLRDVQALRKTPLLGLAALRAHPALQDLVVLKRGNRLSITPVEPAHWALITEDLLADR